MTLERAPHPVMSGEMRLPLPGIHPVLTMQINATVHKATGLVKAVSILRDPMVAIEVSRQFLELEAWSSGHRIVRDIMLQDLANMGYLMSLPTAVYQP